MAAAAMDNSSLLAMSGDYKALVCILLGGGNDSFNMLMPKGDTEYGEYAITRSNLAIPQNDILQIDPNTTSLFIITGDEPHNLSITSQIIRHQNVFMEQHVHLE